MRRVNAKIVSTLTGGTAGIYGPVRDSGMNSVTRMSPKNISRPFKDEAALATRPLDRRRDWQRLPTGIRPPGLPPEPDVALCIEELKGPRTQRLVTRAGSDCGAS
jgi:hypothetical protein